MTDYTPRLWPGGPPVGAYFPTPPPPPHDPVLVERARVAAQEEFEEAQRAVAREDAALAAIAPGLPPHTATGPELATALAALVPESRQRLTITNRPMRRRHRLGWKFSLWTRKPSERPQHYHSLVVLEDGHMQRRIWPSPRAIDAPLADSPMSFPTDLELDLSGRGDYTVHAICEATMRAVRRQVLDWRGVSLPKQATPREHYLTMEHPHPPLKPDWYAWQCRYPEW